MTRDRPHRCGTPLSEPWFGHRRIPRSGRQYRHRRPRDPGVQPSSWPSRILDVDRGRRWCQEYLGSHATPARVVARLL